MYIKSFLKDSTTVVLHINKLLDCKGNRTEGNNGTKDYINHLGLTDERCKELFGVGVEVLLSMALTNKDVGSVVKLEIKIEEVDYEAISEEVFIGMPPEKSIPLSEEMLKKIL
tara:strand:- start:1084 stop:1422 length:339 start_codon:yes stop_codon:yes gene_type:complete